MKIFSRNATFEQRFELNEVKLYSWKKAKQGITQEMQQRSQDFNIFGDVCILPEKELFSRKYCMPMVQLPWCPLSVFVVALCQI